VVAADLRTGLLATLNRIEDAASASGLAVEVYGRARDGVKLGSLLAEAGAIWSVCGSSRPNCWPGAAPYCGRREPWLTRP
jgi:hypothetical protein